MRQEKIKSPWTPEQVQILKEFQSAGYLHPFTCGDPEEVKECQRRSGSNSGALIPSESGWVCPCGKYHQDWCYDEILNKPLPPDWRINLAEGK